MVKPSLKTVMDAAGISKSYAWDFLNGQQAAIPLAVHVFRNTGWKHPSIWALSEDQMRGWEVVKPWTGPRSKAA